MNFKKILYGFCVAAITLCVVLTIMALYLPEAISFTSIWQVGFVQSIAMFLYGWAIGIWAYRFAPFVFEQEYDQEFFPRSTLRFKIVAHAYWILLSIIFAYLFSRFIDWKYFVWFYICTFLFIFIPGIFGIRKYVQTKASANMESNTESSKDSN